MPLYEIEPGEGGAIRPVPETAFAWEGIWERRDLQRLLRDHIEAISPDTLIVAEELSVWHDSDRRIDLLGVDRDANLVVIELKRDHEGGHMELQALRYAAMVSPLTFSKVVDEYARYLARSGRDEDARQSLLDFLGWDTSNDASFNAKVRVILAAANFSTEITSTVLWLNNYGLDIRCVRMRPYKFNGHLLIDMQSIIPLPEAADYQVQIQEKVQEERVAKESNRDFTKYDLVLGEQRYIRQWKRRAILLIVQYLCRNGITPQQIGEALKDVLPPHTSWISAEGNLDAPSFRAAFSSVPHLQHRYFTDENDLVRVDGTTFALRANRWGGNRVPLALLALDTAFGNTPGVAFSYIVTAEGD